ncbi:cupin domain-containing protein [Microbacterium esteraromaticum]|nr:cupin domain-containing protein [Microbacterium esteraromaticum]
MMTTFYTLTDVVGEDLAPSAAPPIILEGDPQATKRVLHRDGDTEIGIWECTPGVFRSEKKGISEFMHFVSGAGRIEHSDGTTTIIEPGAVLHVHSGYIGTWYVEQPVRKVYTAIEKPDEA